MGRASRKKIERRVADSAQISNQMPPRHKSQAATGDQFAVYLDGKYWSAHSVVLEVFHRDDPQMLCMIDLAADAVGCSVFNLEFIARHEDGAPFVAPILMQAWGQKALACFEWIIAQGLERAHAVTLETVGVFIREFNAAEESDESWPRFQSFALVIARAFAARDLTPGKTAGELRSLGGHCAELASILEAERYAADERDELESMLDAVPTRSAAMAL